MRFTGSVRFVILYGTGSLLVFGQHMARPRPAPRAQSEHAGRDNNESKGPVAPKRESDLQFDRLEKMSPAERRTALETLPAERRDRIEKRLDRLQRLPPEKRAELEERLQKFETLPREQQQQVRMIAKSIQALPQERKQAVHHELNTLRGLPEGERQSRLQSSTWKKQFSPQEQEILKQSSELLPQQP
jgi:hypothetical protein